MEEVEIKHFLKQIPLKREVNNFLKINLKNTSSISRKVERHKVSFCTRE